MQDNQGEKLNPRSLFSDASDSLFASLNMPDGIPASVSTFLVQVDGKNILCDAGLGAFGGQTQGCSSVLKQRFTILSSREWKVITQIRPPGFRQSVRSFSACSRGASSSFTAMRTA